MMKFKSIKASPPKDDGCYLVLKHGGVPIIAVYAFGRFTSYETGKLLDVDYWMDFPSGPANKTIKLAGHEVDTSFIDSFSLSLKAIRINKESPGALGAIMQGVKL